ncbi:hypothetical protein Tco_0836565 [Tanacetum coccineum]
MHTSRGDGVTDIKRRRRDLSRDDVRNLATASGRGRLKEDLESSTWRRTALHARAVQELYKLHIISVFVDSRLESIEQFLNNFANHANETYMNDLEFDDESVDTPLVSPFPHSDNDSDDGEVLK